MYSEISSPDEQLFQPFNDLTIRQASTDDIDFVIETIIESEKSGSNVISTCKIFDLTEDEYKNILKEVLLEDEGDFYYYLKGFLIAEDNGEFIGASGSWIEALDGISSGIMKTSIFSSYLNFEKLKKMKKDLSIIDSLSIPREPLTFQLEHIYIKDSFRKRGLFSMLIKENIKRNLARYPFTKVQTIIYKDNTECYFPLLYLGFKVVKKTESKDSEIYKYYPYNSKVLLELYSEKIQKL